MIRIGSLMNYAGNLLPFVFRRSKSIGAMVIAITFKQNEEVTKAQRLVIDLVDKAKYKGQFQVVNKRIKEVFGNSNIEIVDGSNGNVVIVGKKSPYIRIMGIEIDKAFISLPMSRTTVGIDFVVYVPAELERRESEIIAWLNSVVFAGVGFEIKYV